MVNIDLLVKGLVILGLPMDLVKLIRVWLSDQKLIIISYFTSRINVIAADPKIRTH